MLTRSELPENPVVLAVRDPDGCLHTITTERVRGGKIRMICTCDANRASGWCEHAIQLLCTRYDSVVDPSDDLEFRFEDVVMGTPLADMADEVDVALADFHAALRDMDAKRPSGLDRDQLRRIAELATDLADTASHLDATLTRFKKKLAAGLGS
ncbi:MAG TPA: hypothetical protein VGU45_11595 [Microvirga sp.]|jgi:hypothetical protein|nr:hypothetical protein [Microvirga sp.]